MIGRTAYLVSIAAASTLLFVASAFAQQQQPVITRVLVVNIATDDEPDKVALLDPDGTWSDLQKSGNSYQVTIQAPEPIKWVTAYTLKVKWNGGHELSFPIRIRTDSANEIDLPANGTHWEPTRKTITAIDDRETDVESLLRRYSAAKQVYRGIANERHVVKLQALKLWFDAAYELHRLNDFFGRDDTVIGLARDLEEKAKSDTSFAKAIKTADIRAGYFGDMIKEFVACEWREVRYVEKYRLGGNLVMADLVNSYFQARFTSLSKEERSIVVERQGVDQETLDKNASFITTLISQAPR